MILCNFPGCNRLPHNSNVPHARWTGGEGGWKALSEQRTPAEQMRDRRTQINRDKAERIAAEVLRDTFAGRQAVGGGDITLSGLREVATAAALAALTKEFS